MSGNSPTIYIPFPLLMMLLMIAIGCDRLAVQDNLQNVEYEVTDQFGESVHFPESFEGKVMLVGYVYTHCPDICPMITYNMRDIQREIEIQEEFMLVSVSFDPDRDTPEVLYEYAESYRLNQDNWRLLTGERSEIESMLEKLKISTVKTPTRFTDDNTPIYFIDHTDKITLIDKYGQIRRTYQGSELNFDEVVNDIRVLLKE